MSVLGAIFGGTLGVVAASAGRTVVYAVVTGIAAGLIGGGTFALAAWLSYQKPHRGVLTRSRTVIVIGGRLVLYGTVLVVLAIASVTEDVPETVLAIVVAAGFVVSMAMMFLPHVLDARRRKR